ncbi:pro-resilin-like isoform X7 [Eriocheir sinensis]|uniref:pro-resilin-like isoform X2 n=1 Tax=Eriocheir sinensis TaxID=95602 RepID=UPI0021C6F4BD|nr:pro-resilin-like isoform X2 [Eriocheir sinensis]XP_050729781.1 pro-resilin-like isoform X3 [Eriocheir sinensis]XP_050729783.1 pro-resilin-like isoform X4 [Eriocheir sinensis]XP_050729786.1 pro-resilin-like isoform X7 [Eriocheir sinensis]
MNAKVLLLLALVAAAAADGSRSRERSYGRYDESEEAKYDFSYQVKDDYGNDFGHKESRDDEHTEGEYYNELPDGRRQTVTYYVDGDSGFVADVKYSGEARYDSGSGSREYGGYRRQPRESRESREFRGYRRQSRESRESREFRGYN